MRINQRNFTITKLHKTGLIYSGKTTTERSSWPDAGQWNNVYDHLRLHQDVPEILMLTTYPPKECGIATFSQDLANAIEKTCGDSMKVAIAALEKGREKRIYPGEVKFILDTTSPASYTNLATRINKDDRIRTVIIQHEFGLFPGDYHVDFIGMIKQISKPVSLTFHTVLPPSSPELKKRLVEMIEASHRVVVMTNYSSDILQKDYGVAKNKIAIIPHGTHLVKYDGRTDVKEKYGLKGRTVLSTFGLISRNKNIETTIKALKTIVKKHPDVIFLVLGRTHPTVVEEEGEKYRKELEALVKENELEDHVQFINRYLPLPELLEYLQLTDIYLFTSKDPNHTVSGTFAYAMSCGCGIVSTPIPHARELLSNGSGLLFDFEDENSLATQVLRYLDEPGLRDQLGRQAIQTMAGTAWENVGIKYASLVRELCHKDDDDFILRYNLPELNTTHFETMTDKTGIIQFARINVPDKSSGYTLDDNARALIAAVMHYRQNGDKKMLPLIKLYFRFICRCRLPGGRFLNYIDDTGIFNERNNHDPMADANGRAVWALGYLISNKEILPAAMIKKAEVILKKTLPHLENQESPRSISFALKGLYYYHTENPSAETGRLIRTLAEKLVTLYEQHADHKWKWVEHSLTYANSVIPEALLLAAQATGDYRYKQIAEDSFHFLLSLIFNNDRIKVVSNKGWLQKGHISHLYGEQPIDVAYTILALDSFFMATANTDYLEKMRYAFNWFLGENHLQQIIYNPATGGCYDGLEEEGVNLNQGAESTICYLLARLTMQRNEEILAHLDQKIFFTGRNNQLFS